MGRSSLTSSTSSEDFSSLEWKRSNSQVLMRRVLGNHLKSIWTVSAFTRSSRSFKSFPRTYRTLSPDFDAEYVFILVSDSNLDTIVNVAMIPLGIEHDRTASTPISKRCLVNIEAFSGVATGWHWDEVLNGPFYHLVVSGLKSFLCPVVFTVVAKQQHEGKHKANG